MNRQYCDGRLSGMNALTAQRFISVQSHDEMGVRSDSLTFKFIYAKRRPSFLLKLILVTSNLMRKKTCGFRNEKKYYR